ncbi:galactose-3-O-sulfotransferase 2-like [Crassostrea angulata]|uniref:galactose-3-O-sulfotransferase 2-like n=1 Tax=Magallana angulata TaxID=2784310 RepID=UPI0022B09D8F|nr:galactose-3-O-sulfotransferase 2-like [Crassostrea angulata]
MKRYIFTASLVIAALLVWVNNIKSSWKYDSNTNQRHKALRVAGLPSNQKQVHHIFYLKVHKAGSSTVQNVFLRYGIDRNLTFVVPNNSSGYRNVISCTDTAIPGYNIIPSPKDKHFEMLCFHVLYNRTALDKILPNDTKYVAIVREPYLQFDSTLRYFKPVFGDGQNVRTFLKNPHLSKNQDVRGSFTNNRMAFEFDFPESLFRDFNSHEIQEYLKKLDEEFDVVLVNEYMEESIVLLRRILNWKVKDVIFLILNKNNVVHTVDNTELEKRQLYRQYAKLDYALYEFFFERLWRQINIFGQDIFREISYFKSLRRTVENFCLTDSGPFIFVQNSTWSESFRVSRKDCDDMLRHEKDYVDMILPRQYK